MSKITLVTIGLWLSLMGCSHSTSSESKGSEPVVSQLGEAGIKGNGAIPLELDNGTHWYVTSELNGLWVLDDKGHTHAHKDGNYEALSVQRLSPEKDLLAALNKESGMLELMTFHRSELTFQFIDHIENPKAKLENQCFHNSAEGYLSLLAIDVQGQVDEWLVYDKKHAAHKKQKLRSFSAAPNTIACVSDSERIYLAEEHIGVWSIQGNIETKLVRTPVLLKSPNSDLKDDVSGLSLLADNTLVISSEDAHAVFLVNNHKQEQKIQKISFGEEIKPRTAHGFISDGQLLLSIYDDEGDQYLTRRISYTSYPKANQKTHSGNVVEASFETEPVRKHGDAADDPAIWVNSKQPQKSRILGTDKRSGLSVYDFNGAELQHLNVGRLNNVDLRTELKVGEKTLSLAAASNRTHNSISLFKLNESNGDVSHLTEIPTTLDNIYGLCMASWNSRGYVIANDADGRYQILELNQQNAALSAQKVREFTLPSQPEGCVVDDNSGYLYMGEEDAGIWRTSLQSATSSIDKLISVGEHLAADVEGLAIYVKNEKERFLVASSQGDDSYVAYQIDNGLTYSGRFKVGINMKKSIDGSSETDGLAATSLPLPGYPKGILVVQDGYNQLPSEPQNFKIIDWQDIGPLLLSTEAH
ncbi:phytase [Alteromonas sp. 5E99-2]|uniref:phytase n=1 Tax=Alteromonas sp. 5E99-2 TaxID=2817683 RepID=UPI001A9993CD|nr:phytase [Alteromonas sp. 5E99-2]